MRWLLNAAVLILALCNGITLIGTLRWPQISDDVLMHYVVLLLSHGMAPYRQIVDVNMPGSYLLDRGFSSVFGNSDLAWRLLDWVCLAAACGAMVAVLGRRHWQCGCFAAALFALWHVADGVAQVDQRDFFVSILLLCSLVGLLRALQQPSLGWAAAWGLACGAAVTLKPQTLVLLPMLAVLVSRAELPPRLRGRLLVWGCIGWGLPLIVVVAWLGSWHALGAFAWTCRYLVPYHAAMGRHSTVFLMGHLLPGPLLPLLLLAAAAFLSKRSALGIRGQLVAAYLVFGVFSYWIQGKAYPYHRYPLLIFFFLGVGLLTALADELLCHSRGSAHAIAVAGTLLYGALWLGPAFAAKALRWNWRYTSSLTLLQADITGTAGGRENLPALEREVQCLDTMSGCITVLDRMGLLQNTGFLYDCYFFAPGSNPAQSELRRRFLAAVRQAPPRLFVVTDQWCFNLPRGYQKLAEWPAFDEYLKAHYALRVERQGAGLGRRFLAAAPFGYRIYVLRTDPL